MIKGGVKAGVTGTTEDNTFGHNLYQTVKKNLSPKRGALASLCLRDLPAATAFSPEPQWPTVGC